MTSLAAREETTNRLQHGPDSSVGFANLTDFEPNNVVAVLASAD